MRDKSSGTKPLRSFLLSAAFLTGAIGIATPAHSEKNDTLSEVSPGLNLTSGGITSNGFKFEPCASVVLREEGALTFLNQACATHAIELGSLPEGTATISAAPSQKIDSNLSPEV